MIVGTVFTAAIAAGVAIAAGPAVAENGVIHIEGTGVASSPSGSAAPDATAIEYGLVAKSGGGAAHTHSTAGRSG
ncbi:hypothetical protein [Nocardia sp. NPDC050175]|uniref:hypothetical protein n=1 Tax=Nocardia sp. NPDC050175 TaxID=3364317 RepID=UPI0037AAB1AF